MANATIQEEDGGVLDKDGSRGTGDKWSDVGYVFMELIGFADFCTQSIRKREVPPRFGDQETGE